jgi:hypothetical protein
MTKSQKLQRAIDHALEELNSGFGWYSKVEYKPNLKGGNYKIQIIVPDYSDDKQDFEVSAPLAVEEIAYRIGNSSLCEFVDGIFKIEDVEKLISNALQP